MWSRFRSGAFCDRPESSGLPKRGWMCFDRGARREAPGSRPLSSGLRQRVIAAVAGEHVRAAAAARTGMAPSTAIRRVDARHRRGCCLPQAAFAGDGPVDPRRPPAHRETDYTRRPCLPHRLTLANRPQRDPGTGLLPVDSAADHP